MNHHNATSTPKPNAPDWEAIEADYRAGIKTLRQISGEYGPSPATLLKRAKRDDWARDLNAKIQVKADALVNKALVNSEVNKEKAVYEKQVIDASAEAIAAVRIEHRASIRRHKAIAEKLFAELDAQSGEDIAPLMAQLGEMMRAPDSKGIDKLNDLYFKAVSLPERTKTYKALMESLRIAIDLERDAYNIPKPATGAPDPVGSGEERKRFVLQFVQPSHIAGGDGQ